MVLILDGNSARGAHNCSDLGYLICIRRLFRSRADTNLFLKGVFILKCATCFKSPFNTTMASHVVVGGSLQSDNFSMNKYVRPYARS